MRFWTRRFNQWQQLCASTVPLLKSSAMAMYSFDFWFWWLSDILLMNIIEGVFSGQRVHSEGSHRWEVVQFRTRECSGIIFTINTAARMCSDVSRRSSLASSGFTSFILGHSSAIWIALSGNFCPSIWTILRQEVGLHKARRHISILTQYWVWPIFERGASKLAAATDNGKPVDILPHVQFTMAEATLSIFFGDASKMTKTDSSLHLLSYHSRNTMTQS